MEEVAMAQVKLGRLSERVPKPLTIHLDWNLARALDSYSARYREAYGENESLPDLITAIVSDFLASDRVFNISPPPASIPCAPAENDAPERMIHLKDVSARVGLGKSRLYQMIQAGTFPAPYKLTSGSSRWSASEITDWIQDVKKRDRNRGAGGE
jgi:prophage regulatory protein